uniref:Peptidase M10 metallopeptidase domain-containing protein n=1 Tax=Panagrolaimus davidi TaxID=227884 RepID=A0A914QVV4_9BILA
MLYRIFLALFFVSFFAIDAAPLSTNNTEKWSKSKFTYDILRYPKSVSRKETLDAFGYAFIQISALLPIKFEQVFMFSSEPADIRIVYAKNISNIQSNSAAGIIAFDDNKMFKYYEIGEETMFVTYKDITWAAMYALRKLLQENKVKDAEFIQFDQPLYSFTHYVQPKFILKKP